MRTKKAIQRDILNNWPRIMRKAGTIPVLPPKSPTLLGSSTKTRKGPRKYETRVVYMSPDREAMLPGDTRTLCANASERCSFLCLGHSTGLLITSSSHRARLWKTALFLGDRALFRELLDAEVRGFARACDRAGTIPVVRVDGSSDTGEGKLSAIRNPSVQHYDYTKIGARVMRRGIARKLPANYSLTLSYSGENGAEILAAVRAGVSVAVVVDADPRRKATELIPSELNLAGVSVAVVDGDTDDLRFRDPIGSAVLLRFKSARNRSRALATAGAFVVQLATPGAWELAS